MPPKSEPSTRDTATMDVKPKMETKPTVKAELPQDVKAELPQDVKPDITALENDSKPSLSHLEDEAGQKDIKPAIPGLKPQGVDFKPVRHVELVERYPGHFKIIIMGNKDGAEYRIKYMVAPATTVHWLKGDLTKWYGYETDKIRLIFDGRVVSNQDTMASLQAEEGDMFDVYLEQLGG